MLVYAAVVIKIEHKILTGFFVYWLLPNYQQDFLNAMVTSFLTSASSLIRLCIALVILA